MTLICQTMMGKPCYHRIRNDVPQTGAVYITKTKPDVESGNVMRICNLTLQTVTMLHMREKGSLT